MSESPDSESTHIAEVLDLAFLVHESLATPEQVSRLESLCIQSQAANDAYRTFVAMLGMLQVRGRGLTGTEAGILLRAHYSPEELGVLGPSLDDLTFRDWIENELNATKGSVARPSQEAEVLVTLPPVGASHTDRRRHARRQGAWTKFALAAAVVGAVLAGVWGLRQISPGQVIAATLTKAEGCQWDVARAVGEKFGDQIVTLKAGLAEFEFADGAIVLLKGPSEFEIKSSGHARLNQGRLSALVPPAAIGFTIDTPSASIVDFGTKFDVECNPVGETRVLVTRGEVQVEAAGKGGRDNSIVAPPHRLVAGNASLISRDAAGLVQVRTGMAATIWPAFAALALPASETNVAQQGQVNLPISYTAPTDGFVSMALYDQAGVLVRSLLYAEPVKAGKAVVGWDATSDLGKPVAPGTYTPRGIFFTEPPKLDYVMKVGKSGTPPWRTPDGKGDWGGNLSFPSALVANRDCLVMAWAGVEDNQITGVQRTDADGSILGRYFTFYPWDQRMAAAIDERNFYLSIYNYDTKKTEIAEYALNEPRGKILCELPVKAIPQKSGRWQGRATSWVDGLAITGDTIYAAVAQENAIFIVDRATGKLREKADVPAPHGLVVADGKLVVVSGTKVLSLSLDGKIIKELVPEGTLKAPNALARDAGGNLYVGDSADSFWLDNESLGGGTRQVHVFDPAGKPLRRLGAKGGAPRSGVYNADGFGEILAMAIGPDGKLWVHDLATGFRRTSRWTVEGKREREWFSRKIQHVADIVNWARPNELLSARCAADDSPPGLYAYEVDGKARTWKTGWSYELTRNDMYAPAAGVFVTNNHGNPFTGVGPDIGNPIFDFGDEFASRGGKNYMLQPFGNGEGAIHAYSPEHPPKPVALIGYHRVEKVAGRIQAHYDQGPNNWFTWADRNGDGRMSTDETIFIENPPAMVNVRRVSEARFDADLNIRLQLFEKDDKGLGTISDATLPVKELLPGGVPVYDWSMLRRGKLATPDLSGGDGTKKIAYTTIESLIDTGDAMYALLKPDSGISLRLPGLDGDGWWASRNWRHKIARFDTKTGALRWAVGRRAPGRALPGQMYNPIMLAGVAGNAVYAADGLSVTWVWNTDGLYLGRLYNDFASGLADDQTIYVEQQGTHVYTNAVTGKIYSIVNDTGALIHEVILPKQIPVTGSPVVLSADQSTRAVPWDPDGLPPTERPTYLAYSRVGEWPVTVNGELDGREGWDAHAPDGKPQSDMLVLLEGRRVASVQAMYDAKNLYLGYTLQAPHGPINSGSELPISPFVSGAYVDFHIGPEWKGTRDEVLAGDVRVILARIKEGAGFANYQRGFWSKKPGGENPQTITSPAAQEKFDDISAVPGLQMAYRVGDVNAETKLVSYWVEVAVPLASLGLNDPAGKAIGFDASVGVANAAGDRRERAAHWAGLSEGIVVDRPGSARLLPHTWGTLKFVPSKQVDAPVPKSEQP